MDDVQAVAFGCNDWGQEEAGGGWVVGGEAAALVQQDCSVLVYDLDVVCQTG